MRGKKVRVIVVAAVAAAPGSRGRLDLRGGRCRPELLPRRRRSGGRRRRCFASDQRGCGAGSLHARQLLLLLALGRVRRHPGRAGRPGLTQDCRRLLLRLRRHRSGNSELVRPCQVGAAAEGEKDSRDGENRGRTNDKTTWEEREGVVEEEGSQQQVGGSPGQSMPSPATKRGSGRAARAANAAC